jgi:hypothetical protein
MTAPIASQQIKTLWLIEDDRIYRDVLCQGLNASLKGVKIESFATESQAIEQMKNVEAGAAAPDLVIADVMIPYLFPGEGEVPEEIAALGDDSFRAGGVRLWKRARSSESSALRSVPWVYHSVLRPKSMKFDDNSDKNTGFVSKDQEFKTLVETIRTDFGDIDLRWDETDETESNLLGGSPKMRERLLAAMRLPLEQCLATLE